MTAAFLGWFVAWVFIVVVGLAAWRLGLVQRPQGSGLHDWPYPEAGRASLAANTVVWLWVLALTALLIRGLFADRIQRPVSAVSIFLLLVLTGFAPALPHGLLELPWLVSLVATAAFLRLAPEYGPPAVPKRVTGAAVAMGALLLAIPALHGFLHPLWLGGSAFSDPWSRNTATISLRNAGLADLELEAVSLWASVPLVELVGVRVDKRPPPPPGAPFHSPQLPFTLKGRSEAFVQLRLRRMGCGSGPLRTEATVRYRVRGDMRVETLPVLISPRPCS